MREILFRAKVREDKGSYKEGMWINGDLVHNTSSVSICRPSIQAGARRFYKVIPETIGQFTGLLDNKGNKIFDGYIVVNSFGRKFLVDFETLINGVKLPSEEYREIVGNIHENPELLEGDNG